MTMRETYLSSVAVKIIYLPVLRVDHTFAQRLGCDDFPSWRKLTIGIGRESHVVLSGEGDGDRHHLAP